MTLSCDTQKIRRTLLSLLMRRDHTEYELLQKMLVKGHDAEAIMPIIHELTETGLINEIRFIENYIYFRRKRGYGPVRIAQELKARGLTSDVIAKYIEINDNHWDECAYTVWRKHFKNTPPKNHQAKSKQQRFLQYRGFTGEQIQKVFRDRVST